MNIENYLYLAANSFGVTFLTVGVGAALAVIGVALMALALVLRGWTGAAVAETVESGAKKPARKKAAAKA